MQGQASLRLGWWGGIVGTILIFVGFFSIDAGGTTPVHGPVQSLAADMVRAPGRMVVGSLLGMVGALLTLWFAATLRDFLSMDQFRTAVQGSAAFGFAVMLATGAVIHGALRLSLTDVQNQDLMSEAARALAILAPVGMTVVTFGAVGLVSAISIAAFQSPLMPRFFAAFGLLLCLAAVGFSPTNRGAFTIALLPWLAAASAILLRRASALTSHQQYL